MRKNKIIKVTAVIIVAAMLFTQNVFALGTIIHQSSVVIGEGTTLNENIYTYSSSRQDEHYFEYTPNDDITPVVVYGSKVCNYGNFQTMAALLEKKGWNVLGGTNGDYYVMTTCQPVGTVITDGVIRSSDGGFYAIGFKSDGTAFIDKPAISASVAIGSQSYRIYGINKAITDDDFYLYTDAYGITNQNTKSTVNVVLGYPEGFELKPNCEAELTVEDIFDSSSAAYMREGKFILSLTQNSSSWRMDAVNNLKVGDKVTVKVSCDSKWDDVDFALGSLYKIITNGVVDSSISDSQTAPRTAVGIKADGSIIFYTVDGRQSGYSAGLTIPQVAERLKELGCTEACMMDGGGSTNLHAQYIGDDDTTQVNSPSGGTQRSVSDYIMLAAKGSGSGELKLIGVYPYDAIMLAGSSTTFTAKGADETSRSVAISDPVEWSVDGNGTIDASTGVYTSSKAGTDYIAASSGDVTARQAVTVINTPDSITLSKASSSTAMTTLTMYCGETASLKASAKYDVYDVISDASAYQWTADSSIGTINAAGQFTAGDTPGTGTIKVTAGSCSKTISVTVKPIYKALEDYENYTPSVSGLSVESSRSYVCYGTKSLKVQYSCSNGSDYAIPTEYTAGSDMNYVSLWAYGDGSSNKLVLQYADGTEAEIGSLQYSGWKQFTVPLSGKHELDAVLVRGSGSGTIYLDQIVSSTSPDSDKTAPTIDMSLSGGSLTAVINDDSGIPAKSNVSVYCDGEAIDFDYNESTGALSASVSTSGYHRVTIKARDESGNITSQSKMSGGASNPFADTSGHWASEYISYMYSRSIVDGMEEGGQEVFYPDSNVTRAQFAVMICRWQGIDTSAYSSVSLNFADVGDIPDYALNAVKAAYSLGIMEGLDSGGKVIFAPSSSLTREQAMTVIGRVQDCGYKQADISGFTDASKVQSWSAKYVKELVGRGVISGFDDGSLQPSGTITRAQTAKILTEVI